MTPTRRTFIAGALSVPIAVSMPLPAKAAPVAATIAYSWTPVVSSFAWDATPEQMTAELLAMMQVRA